MLVLRVYRHAGVAHHSFRPGGGHHDIAAAVGQRVADMPQVAGLVGILHLGIGQRRQTVGTPVDDAASLVDEALFIHLAECLAHSLRAALIHRKAASRPVAAHAELFLLLDDAVSVFFFPRPDALEELLAAEIVPGLAFIDAELFFDLDLRGDARVVCSGEPERAVALHALVAGQDVLQRRVQRVPHVQLPRDVGRRHDDRVGLFVGVGSRLEAVVFHPHLVDRAFDLLRLIHLG